MTGHVGKPAPHLRGPIRTVPLTPANQTQGVRVDVDAMYLDDIPKAMDHMGWTVSAKLVRRWFATKPAWAMPEQSRDGKNVLYSSLPASQLDDHIIQMKWALGFDRVLEMFENFARTWNTPKAIELLTDRLIAKGWTSGRTTYLGEGLHKAKELDRISQVNYREFGEETDPLDDLYGALFKANLKIAVKGKASRSLFTNRDIFEIEKLGIYIRDTYDFNSTWLDDATLGLGIWSKERVLTKKEMLQYKTMHPSLLRTHFPGFVPARNSDFRNWQRQRNEGGDFFVFSDVLWVAPAVAYVFL